ncbi:MAG: DUF2784 domain-containing protein [Mycobacterium sp.]
MYQIAVVLIVALHLAFICYVVVGGFLALRWRRSIWAHVPAAVWGILIVTTHLDCPLTGLERRARAAAGMVPLPAEGFVVRYLNGVLYPVSWAGAVELAVPALVVLSWVWYAREGLRRRRYRGRYAGTDHL